jgi:glycosyl transferase, family 25
MAPPIIVINLDRDTDRLAHMQAELARLGLPFERFPALRGDALPTDLARYFPFGAQLSPGEIGCYASHLAIMQRVAVGQAPVLVLEDDVGLPEDLPRALDSLLAALPRRWDIVRLSYHTKLTARPLAYLGAGRALVRYSHVPTTTGAYLISPRGARKFLAERPRSLPIDHDLRRVWDWDLDTYGVGPPLVRDGVLGQSSIDSLSPDGRACAHRRMRKPSYGMKRIRHEMRAFGFSGWLAVSALNTVARLTPRRFRPAFVQWANARLAQTVQPPGPAAALASALMRVITGAPASGLRTSLNATHSDSQAVRVNRSTP